MFLGGWLSPFPGLQDLAFDRMVLRSGGPLVHRQAGLLHVPLPVAARDVSALPLRPDHETRMEGLHSVDNRVDRGGGRLRFMAGLPPWFDGPREVDMSKVRHYSEELSAHRAAEGAAPHAPVYGEREVHRSSTRSRRPPSRRVSAGSTRCAATRTGRSAASRASSARRCARRSPSPSIRSSAPTEHAAPRDTTSICSSASSAASVKSRAPSIPSWRRGYTNITSRNAARTS